MEETITVFVEGLEFYGFHGVPAEERAIGHRYSVDLEMQVVTPAATTDRVEDSVDYGQVARHVAKLGEDRRFLTVERLAGAICEDLFERFPGIDSIRLRVAKRLPPAPMIAETAGVVLSRSRSHSRRIA